MLSGQQILKCLQSELYNCQPLIYRNGLCPHLPIPIRGHCKQTGEFLGTVIELAEGKALTSTDVFRKLLPEGGLLVYRGISSKNSFAIQALGIILSIPFLKDTHKKLI